jgi:nucleotide-binding universal stress UspA family protein
MYKKILIPLENSNADRAILEHIKPLAKLTGASLTLMHVADGWVARNFDQLNLAESDEIKTDRVYLQSVVTTLQDEGFEVTHTLVKFTREHKVDLIAMSTHGHRFISDLLYGSTADKVRHLVDMPVLLLKAKHSA